MNQQRSRRFRSAQEAKEKDQDNADFLQLLKQQNGGSLPEGKEEGVVKKTWDSNQITPGTPFMHVLATSLRYWCAYKINTDPGWENVSAWIAYLRRFAKLSRSKSSSRMQAFLARVSTRLWSLSGHSVHHPCMIPTLATCYMVW
jgi:hypothetical protein